MTPRPAWYSYQERAATFFRDLGMTAHTNVKVSGARTNHDVDVLVTFTHGGLKLTWIVECKRWQEKVSKLHVLALRQIVEDVGADRGILLPENGFQSGSIEAVENSNVSLSNIEELSDLASDTLIKHRLMCIPPRLAAAHQRYWSLGKGIRIEHGLHPDVFANGYSGAVVMSALQDVFLGALAGQFPPYGHMAWSRGGESIKNIDDALRYLESELAELESRLGRLT